MYTSRLAEFAAETTSADLEQEVVSAVKVAYLDWLGSALAGATSLPGRILGKLTSYFGGHSQATVLVNGEKTSVLNAALVNAAISHVVELDDVHRGGIIHAGAAVIPAALAASEAERASGSDLIAGIALGYEVAIRIAEAVTPSHYRYWHTTGTCGTFGAAVAVGKILGLDAEAMHSALGSAGTQASGLWEFLEDSAMSKHLHTGKAAMNGALSAYLARGGFTAARQILEGRRGFFAATAEEVDPDKILAGLGEPGRYKILENSYKVHASCRHTHAAVDAALDLRAQLGPKHAEIARLTVHTYQVALDITGDFDPKTLYGAKFSLPFCTGLALVRGSAGLDAFTDAALNSGEVRRLMAKTELKVDPDLDRLYPAKWPVRIEVELVDGRTHGATALHPKGDPENPLTEAEHRQKFENLASHVLPTGEIDRLIDEAAGMEQLSSVARLLPKSKPRKDG